MNGRLMAECVKTVRHLYMRESAFLTPEAQSQEVAAAAVTMYRRIEDEYAESEPTLEEETQGKGAE